MDKKNKVEKLVTPSLKHLTRGPFASESPEALSKNADSRLDPRIAESKSLGVNLRISIF